MDVEEKDEVVSLQFKLSGGAGIVERGVATRIHAGSLNNKNLINAFRDALCEQGRIIIDAVCEGVHDKPGAGKSMAASHHHEGIQAAHVQHRHIQASTEFPTEYLLHKPDTLPLGFETGRYGSIGDSFRSDDIVQGGHLLLHSVRIASLVLVQRRAAGPFLQQDGGFPNQLAH